MSTETSQSVMDEIKQMREDIARICGDKNEQQASTSGVQSQQEDQSHQQSLTRNEQEAQGVRDFFKKSFECKICYNVAELPVACCQTCQNLIGCIPCVEQWKTESGAVCILCRSEEEYSTVPVVREFKEILSSLETDQGVDQNDE